MIEIKVYPDGPCDECKRKTGESIKGSIQELTGEVCKQVAKETIEQFAADLIEMMGDNKRVYKKDVIILKRRMIDSL